MESSHKEHSHAAIDLSQLFSAVWQKKWTIILISAIFAVGSIFYALSLPNQYTATAILSPATPEQGSKLGGLGGSLGGIASLAGINLGGGSGDKSALAMELLQTWGFLERFIQDNKLQADVFAVENWDKEQNKLIYNSELYDEKSKKWVRDPSSSLSGQSQPSSWELYETMITKITVEKDDETGFIRITAEHVSPYVAKHWVDLLVQAINSNIQQKDIEHISKKIDYLQDQINKTSIAEMHTIFYELIKEQTQTLMLAKVSDEYALQTISEAKVAEEKSKPSRAVIVVLMTMLGGFFGLSLVIFRHFVKTANQ